MTSKLDNLVEDDNNAYTPVGSLGGMDFSNGQDKSQHDASCDGVVTYERPKIDSHSIVLGPGNTSFDNFVEQTKLIEPGRVRELYNEFEDQPRSSTCSVEEITIVEDDDPKLGPRGYSEKEKSELDRQQEIKSLKKALPELLRVKDFVITTEDVRLAKNLMTRTVEITKFQVDHMDPSGSGAGIGNNWRTYTSGHGGDNEFDRASSICFSQDEFAANLRSKKMVKPFEWFSGEDPCCNCANLAIRMKGATRKEIAFLVLWVFVLLLAIIAVVFWFNVVLADL